MGRKCGVEGCLSDSNRPEDIGVTFHKVPMHNDIRPKWISLCRIPDDKKNTKVIYICSRHFLRMDFCNFKGKKYMLRQGVLPSVFPWDKSKLEAIKSNVKGETEKVSAKEKLKLEDVEKIENDLFVKQEPMDISEEMMDFPQIKVESEEAQEKPKSNLSGPINFTINSRIEVLDNNNVWYPARIVEEDYEENEVLIHFEKFSNKYDEWICMDSPRLRPLQSSSSSSSRKGQVEQYAIGERCLASWSDARKFPATVTKVLSNDTYEVLFDDGFVKNLKAHRMCKSAGRPMQSSPLFDPIQSSKQERRDKKRKINIAALFGKRARPEIPDEKLKLSNPDEKLKLLSSSSQQTVLNTSDDIFEPWVPQWEGGKPVGIDSTIDSTDGTRKSIIVPDPRLTKGWTKHLAQRIHGASAGKWDTIIVSPDNRRFRSRTEVKAYLEETKLMAYNWSMFDFSIHRHRNRKKDFEAELARAVQEPQVEKVEHEENTEPNIEEENKNCLTIPIVDDAYQCPIEGCGKTYRKENLAQMHVKHYHPEYVKFLDSTPNVADLAYARTVGESLDKSPSVKSSVAKPLQKVIGTKSTGKSSQSPHSESEIKQMSPKSKDSEIIKLLNTKPHDVKEEHDSVPVLPAGLPSSAYPDIKLKDLLHKSDVSNRDDLSLRTLGVTRPSTGIKTLLPVTRTENKPVFQPLEAESVASKLKSSLKRKRGLVDSVDSPKGNEQQEHTYTPQATPPLPQSNNIIIEGGQVIKIVRMKQEEIINCTCGYTEEDGLMIQCDLCLCWQHAFCNNIERESQVPEKYVCYICQHPLRQRLSKKYFHDQEWLKHGVLASTNFHSKDEDALSKRFAKLKKSHDLSGGLLELRDFVNTLKVKLKIAEAKNHPKLYLWSKAWEKLSLPEKVCFKDEEVKPKDEKVENDVKAESSSKEQNDSVLMMILNGAKEDPKAEVTDTLNSLQAPIVPEPEAAIDSADCRLNLLEHIAHQQSLVEERLDEFEKQMEGLEDSSSYDEGKDYPKTRQTLNMLLRDLSTLQELSQLTTL